MKKCLITCEILYEKNVASREAMDIKSTLTAPLWRYDAREVEILASLGIQAAKYTWSWDV